MSQCSYCSQRPMPTRMPPILHKDLALGTKSPPQAEEPGWGSNGLNEGWLPEMPFEKSFRLTQRKDEKEIRPHWTWRRTHTVLKSGARSYTVQISGQTPRSQVQTSQQVTWADQDITTGSYGKKILEHHPLRSPFHHSQESLLALPLNQNTLTPTTAKTQFPLARILATDSQLDSPRSI